MNVRACVQKTRQSIRYAVRINGNLAQYAKLLRENQSTATYCLQRASKMWLL